MLKESHPAATTTLRKKKHSEAQQLQEAARCGATTTKERGHLFGNRVQGEGYSMPRARLAGHLIQNLVHQNHRFAGDRIRVLDPHGMGVPRRAEGTKLRFNDQQTHPNSLREEGGRRRVIEKNKRGTKV